MQSIYIQKLNTYAKIIKKLKESQSLSQEEIKYVCDVLMDPLQEFCSREASFRLTDPDLFGLNAETANSLQDEGEEAIRDYIDNSERLYDDIDDGLREIIFKHLGK